MVTINDYEQLRLENEALREKLDIAIDTLKDYADPKMWEEGITDNGVEVCCGVWGNWGESFAQEALEKIKEIK